MARIEIKNLKKSYGKSSVLDIPQITFEKGVSVGIFGANGCGKSTFIKCISSLLPYDGEIFIDGVDIKKDPSPLSNVGILIEDAALFRNMSGRENIQYFCNDISKLDEYANILNVKDILDIKARKYSIGMKQKIAILLACVKGSKVILLDEPFNGLDIISVEKAINLLQICRNNGATIILTSHQLEVSQTAIELYYLLKDKKIFNCTATQKGFGSKYLLEYLDKDHAKKTYDALSQKGLNCSLQDYIVKVVLAEQNIYDLIDEFKEYPIKRIEDITHSVIEAYLAMEEK